MSAPVRCRVEGCSGEIDAIGYCKSHYMRYRRHGDPAKGRPNDPLARFLAHVDMTGTCWIWRGSRTRRGYGRVKIDGKIRPSHRVAYILYHGSIPPGTEICHDCPGGDNPSCVRREHLFAGSHAANMADAAKKLRWGVGEDHHSSRLSNAQVAAMRTQYAAGGVTTRQLARAYGISPGHVSRVLSRKKRGHGDEC